MTRFIHNEFVRYVIVGGANTALSYLIYLILRIVLPYPVAYAIAYICGVPSAYYLQSRFVFHQPLHWKKAFQFPLVYLFQFLASEALLVVWVEWLHVSQVIAPILVIICVVPATFVLSRLIIKGRKPNP